MGALADLWKSERGLVAIVLIAAATLLAALHNITYEQWLDFEKWIFVSYAASKTVTASVALAKGTTEPPAAKGTTAAPAPATPPAA